MKPTLQNLKRKRKAKKQEAGSNCTLPHNKNPSRFKRDGFFLYNEGWQSLNADRIYIA
jgi:hypothetical protein